MQRRRVPVHSGQPRCPKALLDNTVLVPVCDENLLAPERPLLGGDHEIPGWRVDGCVVANACGPPVCKPCDALGIGPSAVEHLLTVRPDVRWPAVRECSLEFICVHLDGALLVVSDNGAPWQCLAREQPHACASYLARAHVHVALLSEAGRGARSPWST
jgi:hypothetical protein